MGYVGTQVRVSELVFTSSPSAFNTLNPNRVLLDLLDTELSEKDFSPNPIPCLFLDYSKGQ